MIPFKDTPLELDQLQYLVAAMHDLATSDGVHDAERIMLRSFYAQCQQDAGALTSFDDLVRTPPDLARAKEVLPTPQLAEILVQSLLLLAYADGAYSAGERAKVRAYAEALGIDQAGLLEIEERIGDLLLQQVSRIENTEALRAVASELKPGG